MDQVKTGKFIASMRKAQGLTQEALGAKLGVTNKTISRWETGAYMSDIEKLQALSSLLGVSVNELLSGERIADAERFAQKADENLVEALSKNSAFGLQDRIIFFKRKWLNDHKLYLMLWIGIWLLACIPAVLMRHPVLWGIVCLFALFIYGHIRNQMMIYVESKAYDGTGLGESNETQ